jgi:hypothetical protein
MIDICKINQCRYTVYWSGSIIDPIHSVLVGFNNRYIYIINHVSADTQCTGRMIPWGTNSLTAEISTQ